MTKTGGGGGLLPWTIEGRLFVDTTAMREMSFALIFSSYSPCNMQLPLSCVPHNDFFLSNLNPFNFSSSFPE